MVKCRFDELAFYAAVEELDRPDLKDKPMAVGVNIKI
jgi:nucleotidyltransferase/DNA polymerase involved in DNA repair